MTEQLSHLDESGRVRMVDIGAKPDTERTAIAKGEVRMLPATLGLIQAGAMKKGDVLTVAQLAGVMGAKRTADLIPLCHPLACRASGSPPPPARSARPASRWKR
jgi:cyclic pyranopterin phosphate synthase